MKKIIIALLLLTASVGAQYNITPAVLSAAMTLTGTITAGGTTAPQTINKPFGRINLAAVDSSKLLTNSQITASSVIFTQIGTADATCTFVKSAVAGAGSVTITMNAACTAETAVGFLVVNAQ